MRASGGLDLRHLPLAAMAPRLGRMRLHRNLALATTTAASLLVLGGCSGGGDVQAFCDFNATVDERFVEVSVSPDGDVIAAADEGDMSGIHEWGEQSAQDLDELAGDLRTAESNAPTEGSAEAMEVMANAIDTMKEISDLASSADSLDGFFEDAEPLYMAVDEEILGAGDIDTPVEEAVAEHCA